jgi:hypothetical protein
MEFDEFRKLYIKQHRSSVPNRGTQGWIRTAAIMLFVSSAMVSGAHTIPTIAETLPFQNNIIGVKIVISIVSLFMVEIALFAIAFVRRMNLLEGRLWLGFMQFVALVVAIAGNLYSTFEALGVDIANPNMFTLVVGIAVGLGAPLLTMLSGDILAAVEMSHHTAWKEFDTKVLAAFKKEEKRRGNSIPSIPRMENGNGNTGNRAPFRSTGKRDIVRQHFAENPEYLEMSPIDLEDVIGAKKSLIYDVRREILANTNGNGHSPNGHGGNE